jgi:regulator of RNase E activity RraB
LTACTERRLVTADALRDCPVGTWISVDELFRQMQLLGRQFAVTFNAWGLYFSDPQYGALGHEGYGGFDVLQAR